MPDVAATIRRHLAAALIAILLLGGTATAWSVWVPFEGAVVAQGTVVVESNVKKVQHPSGGIIGTLNVREGSRVEAGDVLLRLDETAMRAQLAIVLNDLTALRARFARLEAEREGRAGPEFSADLVARRREPDISRILDGEIGVFETRARTRNGKKAQLAERIKQLKDEITGLGEQKSALVEQLKIARAEAADLEGLRQKGLAQRPRVTGLQREVLRLEGLSGDIRARIARAEGRIAETELQMLQIDRDTATEAAKEVREVETKISELQERKTEAEDQLRRIDIRAPISGQVHQLAVHTIGGVVAAGEPIMLIVPAADRLMIEVRVAPTDIDQLALGQETRVRFPAFNQRTTPEVVGSVFRIAGDLARDQQTGLAYYTAGIRIADEEFAKLKELTVVPGMPAEAYIRTASRTLASYLFKPLTDQMMRAMRED